MGNYIKKTITIAFLVASYSWLFAFDNKDENKLEANYSIYQSGKANIVNLIYHPTSKKTEIRIFSPKGSLILKDVIKNKLELDEVFIRPYNFKSMRPGNYIFEIKENGMSFTHLLEYRKNPVMPKVNSPVSIIALANDKYKVVVNNQIESRVEVNIYSARNKLIYNEIIEENGNFSKLYDLSQLGNKGFTIRVKLDNEEFSKRLNM